MKAPLRVPTSTRTELIVPSYLIVPTNKSNYDRRRTLRYFRVNSMLIDLYSLPVFGSGPNISTFLLFGPVLVSTCRMTAGFLVSGQLKLNFQVSVLPSGDNSPVPFMIPVL